MASHSPRPPVTPGSVRTPRRHSRLFASLRFGLILAAALLAGVGCSNDPGPEDFTSRLTITIRKDAATLGNLGFSPNPAYLAIDTQVIWVNRDEVDHRLVSTAGYFDTGLIKPGQSYQRIFREAGTFRYHDEIPGSNIQGVLNVVN